MNLYNKISHAKKALGEIIEDKGIELQFPLDFFYQESIPGTKFKITVSIIEEDCFVDKFGNKWVKQV